MSTRTKAKPTNRASAAPRGAAKAEAAPASAQRKGTRSADFAVGRPAAIYEAASKHPLIPNVYDPAPSLTSRQQRFLQKLARHYFRNDSFIRNLVNVAGRLYVGEGPTPLSRFPELDRLWAATCGQFDNTGRRSFGGWLRQDVFRNVRIDGEAFVRRRVRDDEDPEAGRLAVPIEFEAFTSEFVPHEYNRVEGGLKWVCGIATVRSKPVKYKMWTEHPAEGGGVLWEFDRDEIYHVHDPLTGTNRGEVMLAAALMRAIKMNLLEDAEGRRKQIAAMATVFLKAANDATDDDGNVMPLTHSEVEDMLEMAFLSSGGIVRLPPGYEMQSFEPKDEPQNYEKGLRWALMAICASVGIPVNEVTGDDNGVERWGRMMSQRVQAQARLERDMLEHQLLNPMRSDWIDVVMAKRLWTPPEDLQPWELYACDWQWPIVPAARLDTELNALMNAVEKGHLPHSYVARTLFGLSRDVVARTAASDAAQSQALGNQATKTYWQPDTPVAQRVADAAMAIEEAERDLVDEAATEDSVLDDDAE